MHVINRHSRKLLSGIQVLTLGKLEASFDNVRIKTSSVPGI